MKRRRYFELVLCLGVIAVGIGIIFVANLVSGKTSQAKTVPEIPVPTVECLRIKSSTLEDKLTITGTVAAWKTATLSAEVGGKIEARPINEGDRVKQGQELFRINTQTLQARLAQAQAQARLANQEYERAQRLTSKGVSAERDLDNALAAKDVAEAEVRTVQIQLEKSVLKAPFEGIIDKCFREENEFVEVGTPLARIIQTDKLKVEVSIPERDISSFKVGGQAYVRCDAFSGESFKGIIHRISTSAEASTRTFLTEIEVDNPDQKLKPGMIARVDLVRAVYPDSILVPIFSTFLLDEQRFVAVVEENKAKIRPITTGIVQGGTVQVLSGLSENDLLIVKGQFDVRDGESVNVREASQ
ncbi:MAG TPA: efflux RND transporter periplasmic adaptor subunit [Candidatus Hydrogenedentes bacterium]|nr:efflux RND transporter periplasmic adaptor subunit [Candidatus Hydrogenedentota bacterium]HOL75589.1 efflux RND transporter periplasmic adaptor subunit [Candidatus Hydrogenedentota bacterium]HPO86987.1 efflux RND transporter periplasmic adaptor subunit [Candidatus Hydrogenedentota bacterium]